MFVAHEGRRRVQQYFYAGYVPVRPDSLGRELEGLPHSFRAPEPLPILNLSNFVPKTGFQL